MSDDKFDAIVVGAGVAGSVAALVMARAGLDGLFSCLPGTACATCPGAG